jgi:hypothetical protein
VTTHSGSSTTITSPRHPHSSVSQNNCHLRLYRRAFTILILNTVPGNDIIYSQRSSYYTPPGTSDICSTYVVSSGDTFISLVIGDKYCAENAETLCSKANLTERELMTSLNSPGAGKPSGNSSEFHGWPGVFISGA